MRITVTDQTLEVLDPDVLTALCIGTDLDARAARSRLAAEGLGPVDPQVAGDEHEHAWLVVDALAELADPGTPGWRGSFAAMIAYAEREGWTSADGSLVRAHLEAL